VETDKTLEEIAQENEISSKTLNNWAMKYKKEGEAAFFKGSRSGSFIVNSSHKAFSEQLIVKDFSLLL